MTDILQEYFDHVNIRGKRRTYQTVNRQQLKAIQYYYEVADNIISRLDEFKNPSDITRKTVKRISLVIDRIKNTSLKINEQLVKDINAELKRYHRSADFCAAIQNPLYVSNSMYETVRNVKRSIEDILFGFRRFTDQEDGRVQELFKDFQRELKSNKPLTQDEKKMIHLAMSKSFYGGIGSSGHWFTCTKGHYYCITECGGAMQTSRCPECGETIGGADHRYVPTARLASDMDGATRPAWSSGNEMGNYVFF